MDDAAILISANYEVMTSLPEGHVVIGDFSENEAYSGKCQRIIAEAKKIPQPYGLGDLITFWT